MCNSILGLYSLDASSTLPRLWQMSPDTFECRLEGKLAPGWKPLRWGIRKNSYESKAIASRNVQSLLSSHPSLNWSKWERGSGKHIAWESSVAGSQQLSMYLGSHSLSSATDFHVSHVLVRGQWAAVEFPLSGSQFPHSQNEHVQQEYL